MQLTLDVRRQSYRSPLSHVGSKKKLYRLMRNHVIPQGTTEMVSPFMGGASLELRLAASGVKVFTSDLFPNFVEFFNTFNGQSNAVVDRVLELYPFTREEFHGYTRYHRKWEEITCPIEKAAVCWGVNRQSYMGVTFQGGFPVAEQYRANASVFRQSVWQDWRNDFITFSVKDYRDALDDHPTLFAYLDPPYPQLEHVYGYGDQGKFNHQELYEILSERQGFALSYSEHPLIKDIWKGYRILRPQWMYPIARPSEQLLILSHDIETRGLSTCLKH